MEKGGLKKDVAEPLRLTALVLCHDRNIGCAKPEHEIRRGVQNRAGGLFEAMLDSAAAGSVLEPVSRSQRCLLRFRLKLLHQARDELGINTEWRLRNERINHSGHMRLVVSGHANGVVTGGVVLISCVESDEDVLDAHDAGFLV